MNEPTEGKWWDVLTDQEVECRMLRHRFTIVSVHILTATGNYSIIIYCPACHAWAHDIRRPDGKRVGKRQYLLTSRYRKPGDIPPKVDTPTHAEWAAMVMDRWKPEPLDSDEEPWRERASTYINTNRTQRQHRR